MQGQMTIEEWLRGSAPFSYEKALDRDLVMRGSLFENGKQRIYEAYQTLGTTAERIAMLKKEYGWGGHSEDFEDGRRGMVSSDANGIVISFFDSEERRRFKWSYVEARIGELIRDGKYMSKELPV